MSLYSLTPNPAEATLGEGTLRVEAPHWSARVSVFDDQNQLIANDTAVTRGNEESDAYEAVFSLQPGIYHVETVLGDTARIELVPVHPDHTTRITRGQKSERQSLQIRSAAPLTGAVDSRERHAAAADQWSRQPTWADAPGGESRLFLFIRTLESGAEPGFAGGLKLLDAGGRLVTDFSDGVRRNTRQGWLAFTADLPPGSYILRRGGRNVTLRFQPLVLAAGWETQAFLTAERYPRLHQLSLTMAPLGAGFHAGDPSAVAAEVLLDGLTNGASRDVVVGQHIVSLLSGELTNPWLAIVAAHALHAAVRRPPQEQAAQPVDAASLLDHVLSVLDPLRDHPDVGALLLADNSPAPAPFWSPPLLRLGLRRIKDHATRHVETVPDGSLTDLVIDDLITSSPWTAWHTLAQMPAPGPTAQSAAGRGRSLLKTATAQPALDESLSLFGSAMARASTPAAPVYYLADAPHTSDWNIASVLPAVLSQAAAPETASDDPTVQVAESMIRPSPVAAAPEVILVDVEGSRTRLLDAADPLQISASLGVPLARTAHSLERLREQPAGDDAGLEVAAEAPPPSPPVAPAVLDAVLEQTVRPLTKSLEQPTRTEGASERPAYIEACVSTLLDVADRLLETAELRSDQDGYTERTRAAGERVHRVADTLLAAAGYTVLTDPDGRVVFGNGAFQLFLTHAADEASEDGSLADMAEQDSAGQRAWEAALGDMPLGASSVPVPPAFAHHAGETWHLQRTAVQDAGSGQTRAFLNVLHNPNGQTIKGDVLRQMSRLLPQLTVACSLFADGSIEERGNNLAEIEVLTERLATLAGINP